MFGGAGRNLGAGDGWRGRMNLVMRGWGIEGRSVRTGGLGEMWGAE